MHLHCSKLITFISVEQHFVYNFRSSWMAHSNKFMFLVAKLSFIFISAIIDRVSYNLLSFDKSFSALLRVATRPISKIHPWNPMNLISPSQIARSLPSLET